MGRLPKIIMMITAMTAIFLWMSTAFNSCGNKADDLMDDSTELLGDISDDAEDFIDDSDDIFEDSDDDIFDDSDDIFEDDSANDNYNDDSDDTFVSGDEAATEYTEPDPEPDYTEPAPVTQSHSSSGQYMVIAGNYLVESNARQMIRKLDNLGYPSSEIGIFDRSQYHTVIAYRSDSYSAAAEVSNAIKRQGVDCYVKRKEY